MQVALCEWCRATWPVKSAEEADRWLRTHPCPGNPKDPGQADDSGRSTDG